MVTRKSTGNSLCHCLADRSQTDRIADVTTWMNFTALSAYRHIKITTAGITWLQRKTYINISSSRYAGGARVQCVNGDNNNNANYTFTDLSPSPPTKIIMQSLTVSLQVARKLSYKSDKLTHVSPVYKKNRKCHTKYRPIRNRPTSKSTRKRTHNILQLYSSQHTDCLQTRYVMLTFDDKPGNWHRNPCPGHSLAL